MSDEEFTRRVAHVDIVFRNHPGMKTSVPVAKRYTFTNGRTLEIPINEVVHVFEKKDH